MFARLSFFLLFEWYVKWENQLVHAILHLFHYVVHCLPVWKRTLKYQECVAEERTTNNAKKSSRPPKSRGNQRNISWFLYFSMYFMILRWYLYIFSHFGWRNSLEWRAPSASSLSPHALGISAMPRPRWPPLGTAPSRLFPRSSFRAIMRRSWTSSLRCRSRPTLLQAAAHTARVAWAQYKKYN